MTNDIFFCPTVLFQEHEIGVWVSRAVPKGNASKKGVQHGDQLAAINGSSSVHATIDEVASTISSTPNNMTVELTFLRYVGPLRPMPGSVIQEGFEVTDTAMSPKKNGASKSKRGIFSSKKKSSGTPPASPGSRGIFGLGHSPKSPKQSPKYTNSPSQPQSPVGSSPGSPPPKVSSSPSQSSLRRQSSSTSAAAAPTVPPLATSPAQPVKKKKSLGKMFSFKKKT